jgi:tetratricopeptide (TPR) repeat protein
MSPISKGATEANGGWFESRPGLFQSGHRRGPKLRPSLFWLSRHICCFGRLAVCGDEHQGSAPQSEGRRDQRSGIGQPAERSSHLTWIQLARPRLVFDSAGKEFRRAIELNPSYATAHHWNAMNLGLLGRPKEAPAEMRKAENLDPLSLIINSDLAVSSPYAFLRRIGRTGPQDHPNGFYFSHRT